LLTLRREECINILRQGPEAAGSNPRKIRRVIRTAAAWLAAVEDVLPRRFGCEIWRLTPDDQISPDYETPRAEDFIAEVRRRTRRHEG
jgi:hypothetical protein